MMIKTFFIGLLLAITTSYGYAQSIEQPDLQIQKMVQLVNPDSLRADITTLVSFGTRNTLSSKTNPQKGIGAARNWVISKFKAFALNAAGRMTVELDQWTLPPDGKRVDTITDMGNPMAILHGTDTADKRIFLISGHMDSRVTDVMNRAV